MKRLIVAAVAVAGMFCQGWSATPVQWNQEELGKAPQVFASGYPEKDGVKSLFFEGVPYAGKPTRVFAYLAMPKVAPGTKVRRLDHGHENWTEVPSDWQGGKLTLKKESSGSAAFLVSFD